MRLIDADALKKDFDYTPSQHTIDGNDVFDRERIGAVIDNTTTVVTEMSGVDSIYADAISKLVMHGANVMSRAHNKSKSDAFAFIERIGAYEYAITVSVSPTRVRVAEWR